MHGFCCYDNICECEMSASACTRSVPGCHIVFIQSLSDDDLWFRQEAADDDTEGV